MSFFLQGPPRLFRLVESWRQFLSTSFLFQTSARAPDGGHREPEVVPHVQASNAIQVGRFQGFLNFIVYLSQEGLGQQSPSETPALSTEVTNAHLSQVGRTVGVVFINFSFVSESNPGP